MEGSNSVYHYSDNNKRHLVTYHDKKLDRNIARWRMKQRGFTQVNKKKSGNPSFFSLNWRDYVY